MALRTPLTAQPHLYIGDSTGRPLDYGRVYFGEPNKDPEFYPIDIYLDPEMTIAAAQPVRTKGGFMDVGGNLAELHAAEVVYSLKVLDQYGRQVFYKPEMYRNNVSDFLVDEITRATAAETLIAGNLTAETQRAVAAEKVIADAVVTEKDRAVAAEDALDAKHAELSSTINSLGGGKKAYTTYALMVADKSNIAANSSIDVTNDTDPLKNGTYSYDGAVFAKSAYEPVLKDKLDTEIASSINAASTVNMSLDDGQKLYVEQAKKTARTLYINVPRFYLAKGSKLNGSYYTWSNIKADLNDPSLFVISTRGYPDCLALNDNSLVLGIADNKFYLVPRGSVKPSEHIVIASATFGQLVGGELLPLWLNKTSTRSKPLLYTSVPNELPYIEKSGNSIYIKVADLQIRLSQDFVAKSWAQLKADIDDPSLFLTSPMGVADCLMLSNSILVFNDNTNKYKVINELNAKNDAETLIARAYNGELVDGLLFEIYARRKNTSTAQATVNKDIVVSKQRYVAHGGLNGRNMLAPYNTLPAVRLAGEYGYWGVETDLVETKDGEWVHCHDLFLSDYVYATGNVADYTLAELKQMDASKKSAVFGWTNVPIMELSEFLKVCVEYNLVPIMEFKSVPTSAGVDKVFDIIKTHTTLDKVALTSFSLPVLQLIRSKSASVQLWLSINVVTTSSINSVLGLGNAVLAASKETPFAKIQEAVAAGVKVARYTLSPDDIKNGFADKISYIVTDDATPYDMQKGHTGLIFNNNPDFSNLTAIGTGVSTNGILNLPSGAAYLDVPAKKGDVITVSFEARKTGTGLENPTVDIRLYKVDNALLTVYTTQKVTKGTFDVYTLSSVVRDSSFGTARIFISAAVDSGIELRGLKVKRLEF